VAGKARDSRSVVDYWRFVTSQDEDEMMCYVALYGPLHVSMFVKDITLTNYKAGIWDDPKNTCPTDGSINHALALVGFGTEMSQTGELMDYWLVQNRLNYFFSCIISFEGSNLFQLGK
jgi:Papain family cysteine protease